MAIDLTGEAMEVVTTSNSLITGRERIQIDALIAKYPEGISINGFNAFEYMGSPIYSYTFAEDKSKYFSGGGDLFKMGQKWIESHTVAEINESLKEVPVRIKVSKVRTRNNKTYTRVDVQPSKYKAAGDDYVDIETGEVKKKKSAKAEEVSEEEEDFPF